MKVDSQSSLEPLTIYRNGYIGAGRPVAFMDDHGPGHSSKVGPDGVWRTLRELKGHLQLP